MLACVCRYVYAGVVSRWVYFMSICHAYIWGKRSHQEWEDEWAEGEDRDSVQGSAEPGSFA